MSVATAREAHRLRLRLRRHPRIHVLVRCHRRGVPDHGDTWDRPVHGATVLVQPLAGRRAKALLVSGVFVLAQFPIFLVIGLLLYVFYTGHAAADLAPSPSAARVQTDRVLPQSIVGHLPTGLLALSAAISGRGDVLLAQRLGCRRRRRLLCRSPPAQVRAALPERVAWRDRGVRAAAFAVALAAISLSRRVVDEVLGIASFTNGVIFGVLLLARSPPASSDVVRSWAWPGAR